MYRRLSPVKKRNALLLTGLILLSIAFVKKPSLLVFFLSTKGRASTFLTVLAALFTAFGFREFGYMLLRHPGTPWYVRPGSFFLLVLMVVCYCFVAAFVDGVILASLGVGPIVTESAYIYELFGLVLLWIVLLEWVSCEKGK